MKHLFLTGDIQVGKSTLLQKWLSKINCRTAGFYTRKVPDGEHIYVRIFPASCTDVSEGINKATQFAEDNRLFDCKGLDKLDFTERFDRLGCALLQDLSDADLIIMDEIGIKENRAEAFRSAVMEALDGLTPVIGVLRKLPEEHAPGIIDDILDRPDISVIEVTGDNRDALADTLPEILLPFAE